MGNTARGLHLDLTAVSSTDTRIRAASVYLFATKGYAAASIRDIAREVGITNAGVYHFFDSKEALLHDLMRNGQQSLTEATLTSLVGIERPEERLSLLVSGLVGAHVVNRMVSFVTDGELRALEPGTDSHDDIVAMRDEYESHWRSAISDGRNEGLFRIEDENLSRLALLSMCTGVSAWFNPSGSAGLGEITRHHIGVALAAVGATRDGGPVTVDDVPSIDPNLIPRLAWEPRVKSERNC